MASIPSQMKALRFTNKGPPSSSLHVESVPVPSVDSQSVLVQIKAAAINPSDVKNVEGTFPQTTLPRTPGRDFAGIVVAGGPDGSVGKKVWGTGGVYGYTLDGMHAQYVKIPADAVQEMPSNLGFSQAAACGVAYLTASLMIKRSGAKKGDNVLVLGSSGSVGSAAALLLRDMGAQPLETSRSAAKPGIISLADPLEPQIASLTSNKGINVVIDTVSDPSLFQRALKALGPRGTYVVITGTRDGSLLAFNPLDLYREDKTLTGVNSNNVSFSDAVRVLGGLRSAFEKGVLTPPSDIAEVSMTEEGKGVDAYETTKKGSKAKQVLVN